MKPASALILTAMLATLTLGPEATRALAQDGLPVAADVLDPAAPAVTPPTPAIETPPPARPASDVADEPAAASLPDLVARQPRPERAVSDELRCLASAIYFEAKGETLAGQLAVARVIVARAASRRFPPSYCGVVYQRAQFAFIHGRSMPVIRAASAAWREAVAIARIADSGGWRSQAEGALYFHAARVRPSWNRVRIARVDDHVFYR